MNVREAYNPVPMAANAAYAVKGINIAGFLAITSGFVTIVDAEGTVLVNLVPVTLGQWTRIPLFFKSSEGGIVTLSGGASGTLFC